MSAPAIELRLAGRAVPAAALRGLELSLSALRPPEIRLSLAGAVAGSAGRQVAMPAGGGAREPRSLESEAVELAGGAVETGDEIRLAIGGRESFRGRASTILLCGAASGAERGAAEIAGTSRWGDRAAALAAGEEYAEMTDAEAARRIADALGLLGRIDPTGRVHRRLSRAGDPCAFLGERARSAGLIFAVAGETLHFERSLPRPGAIEPEPGLPRKVAAAHELAAGAARTESGSISAGRRRAGAVIFSGPFPAAPLDRVRLRGTGPLEGVFRVREARFRLGPRGISTRLELVERDDDLLLETLPGLRAKPARREAGA